MAALAPLNLLVVIGAHCGSSEVLADKIRPFDEELGMEYGKSTSEVEPEPEDILAALRSGLSDSNTGLRQPLGERFRQPWQPEPEPDPCLAQASVPASPAVASDARCTSTSGAAGGWQSDMNSHPDEQREQRSHGVTILGLEEVAADNGKPTTPSTDRIATDAMSWSDVLQRGTKTVNAADTATGEKSNESKHFSAGKASMAGLSEYLCQRMCPDMIMVPRSLIDLDSHAEGSFLLKLADEVDGRRKRDAPRAFTLVLSFDNVAALLVITMLSVLGAIYLWKICTRRRCTCRLCRNQYRTHHLLGSGGYGAVYLVDRVSDGTRLVAKKIEVREIIDLDEYTREAKELVTLRHRHIVSYEEDFVHVEYGAFEPKTYFIIIMEYCPEGDLKEKIELEFSDFTEDWVRTVFAQLLQAVQYLHSKNVIHRDLKSQNVFLAHDGRVRLGDFGLCRHTQHRALQTATLTHAGTDCYMAPEMLSSSRYGKPADIWSLGCVLYELCTGQFMWELDGILGAMVIQDSHKVSKLLQENIVPAVSSVITSLIKRLLHVNPASRPTVTACIRRRIFKRSFPLSRVPFGESMGEDVDELAADGTPTAQQFRSPLQPELAPASGELSPAQRSEGSNQNASNDESSISADSSTSSEEEGGIRQYPPARNEDFPRRNRRNKRGRQGRAHGHRAILV